MSKTTMAEKAKEAGRTILAGIIDLKVELLRNPVITRLPNQNQKALMDSLVRITEIAQTLVQAGNTEMVIEGYRRDAVDGVDSMAIMFESHLGAASDPLCVNDTTDEEMVEIASMANIMSSRIEQYMNAKAECNG